MASQMAKELGNYDECIELARQSVPYYCESGSQEKAAETLIKAAK